MRSRLLMLGWLITVAAVSVFADDAEATRLYEKGHKLYLVHAKHS